MKIKKVYADALTTFAKGTDAGIYRLNTKRVAIVSREQDVKHVSYTHLVFACVDRTVNDIILLYIE